MEATFAIAAILVLAAANLAATRLVLRDALSARGQKIGQLAMVWLLPVLGAIVVFAVHRRAEPPSRKYRDAPDPGDGFDYAARNTRLKSPRTDADETD